jgi:hypothetical protein
MPCLYHARDTGTGSSAGVQLHEMMLCLSHAHQTALISLSPACSSRSPRLGEHGNPRISSRDAILHESLGRRPDVVPRTLKKWCHACAMSWIKSAGRAVPSCSKGTEGWRADERGTDMSVKPSTWPTEPSSNVIAARQLTCMPTATHQLLQTAEPHMRRVGHARLALHWPWRSLRRGESASLYHTASYLLRPNATRPSTQPATVDSPCCVRAAMRATVCLPEPLGRGSELAHTAVTLASTSAVSRCHAARSFRKIVWECRSISMCVEVRIARRDIVPCIGCARALYHGRTDRGPK